jgi:hypothetical protein
MAVGSKPSNTMPAQAPETTIVTAGVAAFAIYHLLVGAFMAIAPHAFYTDVGPFGTDNNHYIRDVASYNGALAFAFYVAVKRPSWRVPVLALTTVQFVLHSINHLVDINHAHPVGYGYFDFFSLAALSVLLAWLWRKAVLEQEHRA